MAKFGKIKYGLIFTLVSLLLGLPFFHYHPDNAHTHPSELTPHHHEGHFHSNELSGIVGLIHHQAPTPRQSEDHHTHSDTDADAKYFELNLQKSNGNPVKTFKVFKSGISQKAFLFAGPTLFHPISIDIPAFESSRLAGSPIERSPPFPFV
jgi:hypothetical protein